MDQLNRLRSSLNTAGITNLTQAEAALRTNIDRTTNAIKRLGTPASHGCIRLHPDNAADFYQLVELFGPSNTSIVITE